MSPISMVGCSHHADVLGEGVRGEVGEDQAADYGAGANGRDREDRQVKDDLVSESYRLCLGIFMKPAPRPLHETERCTNHIRYYSTRLRIAHESRVRRLESHSF